jgi:hypothetical protein
MYFNYVHMPEEFCLLLKSNMQTTGPGYQILRKNLWDRPQFQAILSRACVDLKGSLSFERIINSLGWLGLRDRLASTYLYHQEHGHFPDIVLLKNIEDILHFEEEIKSQTIDGHGRHFLYAFYIKMNLYYIKRTDPKATYHNRLMSKASLELIKEFSKKTVEVDWLCIVIHHFIEYLGEEKVRSILAQGGAYSQMLEELKPPQKYTMNENFLSYGASVRDEAPFVFSLV